MSRHLVVFSIAFLLGPFSASAGDTLPTAREHAVKHIIFMLGDGMGMSNVTAARVRKNGVAGESLHMETITNLGLLRTYSERNLVTDSAAAASAMACGEKFVNGEVCLHGNNRPHNPSVLELAKVAGWATALVTTSRITDASPAAFASHVPDRACETEIARQYIEISRPNVMLGGGAAVFNKSEPDACGAAGDLIAGAARAGYTVVTTRQQLEEPVAKPPTRLLGLFSAHYMTPEFQRSATSTEPRLSEMTRSALSILENHPKGFFLFVEGAQIDLGNHESNFQYQYGEMLAFDEAVAVVLRWIESEPERASNTLLIITADHDTGGLALVGEVDRPEMELHAAWVSSSHTGVDVPIRSVGPGSERLRGLIDNTVIYRVMKAAIE